MTGRVWQGRPAFAGDVSAPVRAAARRPSLLDRLLGGFSMSRPAGVPALLEREQDDGIAVWISQLRKDDPCPVRTAHEQAARIRARQQAVLVDPPDIKKEA